MKQPLVSVIIPAYNAVPFLREAVDSARKQTFGDIEIIVIDDASKDGTVALAQELAAADSRIRTLRHEVNQGLAATRNTGMRAAVGDWVAFLDADDVFLPGKIDAQLKLASAGVNLLYTNYWHWDGASDLRMGYRLERHMPDGPAGRELIQANRFCPSTVMLPRKLALEVGGFNPKLRAIEDWDMWLRIAERGLNARGVWEPQLRYRVWPGNMSKNAERMTHYTLAVFESALQREQPPERRRLYEKALRFAKANREFALARPDIGVDNAKLGAAVHRAWKHYPWRMKWLLWSALLRWPRALGGAFMAKPALRRIQQKW